MSIGSSRNSSNAIKLCRVDLIFNRARQLHKFPVEHHMKPTSLTTSTGVFQTSKQGKVDDTFPQYSNSKMIRLHLIDDEWRPFQNLQTGCMFLCYSNYKMIRITSDMVVYTSTKWESLYDVITRREALNKLKVLLDFKNSTIGINNVILPMQACQPCKTPCML